MNKEVIDKVNQLKCSLKLEKLSHTTRIDSLTPIAWDFIGATKEEVTSSPFPLIRDLPYDLWRCRIGRSGIWHYGKEMGEAIEQALLYT